MQSEWLKEKNLEDRYSAVEMASATAAEAAQVVWREETSTSREVVGRHI